VVVKAISLLPFSQKSTSVPHTRSLMNSIAPKLCYGEEKNFLPLAVFILQKFPTAESIGRIKEEF